MAEFITEKSEIERLSSLYKEIPEKKQAIAEGLIVQAARLRVLLNKLWADIEKNGTVEWFTQSEKTEPYERERPSARLFNSTDKNYQSIIKQLNDLIPTTEISLFDELDEFRED